MKWILLTPIIILTIYLAFYGSYYIAGAIPDDRGESILREHRIPYPAVIAHRGASIVAPESTRRAYEIARDLGADYLEADLRQTADGRIVVIHDDTPARTSNVADLFPDRADHQIGTFMLAELRRLDFGSWHGPEFSHQEILTLEDLIAIARGGEHTPGLILETKDSYRYPDMEERIVAILRETGWLEENDPFERTIFFSFSLASLRVFEELLPEKPRLLLVADNAISRRRWEAWLSLAKPVAHGLGPKGFTAWPWHIAASHREGMFVFPYTLNYLWQIQVLARFQASGFITDRPEVVINFLNGITTTNEVPSYQDL
ncbi:MAG: glycerophosphodiester phosphodiesterase [Spirochaetaceae bacterium]|nr:MAG: glycerophosphodiester phosphodiesterase [Spirochaetaceae bacterium]